MQGQWSGWNLDVNWEFHLCLWGQNGKIAMEKNIWWIGKSNCLGKAWFVLFSREALYLACNVWCLCHHLDEYIDTSSLFFHSSIEIKRGCTFTPDITLGDFAILTSQNISEISSWLHDLIQTIDLAKNWSALAIRLCNAELSIKLWCRNMSFFYI